MYKFIIFLMTHSIFSCEFYYTRNGEQLNMICGEDVQKVLVKNDKLYSGNALLNSVKQSSFQSWQRERKGKILEMSEANDRFNCH